MEKRGYKWYQLEKLKAGQGGEVLSKAFTPTGSKIKVQVSTCISRQAGD